MISFLYIHTRVLYLIQMQWKTRDRSHQTHNLISQYLFFYAAINLIMRDLQRKRVAGFLRFFFLSLIAPTAVKS